MSGQKAETGRSRKERKPQEVRLRPRGAVILTRKAAPAKPPDDKRIHPRRPLPLIPEGPADDTEADTG